MVKEKKAIDKETKEVKEVLKPNSKTTHTVSKDETASEIATKYHMSLKKLLVINKLDSVKEIKEGVSLIVE
ncbi:MAG: LysM peptidoglycan-binding domain-containing protein [Peptoniphilus lacydonensis]|nr:LysM peptidoglycan-binding domain-containing protein [Peptoniphilus lacydonensis]